MSFVTGTLSGVLIAGGAYYTLSSLIQRRTAQHQNDLASLSAKLIAPPASTVPAPTPAAQRIAHSPIKSMLKGRWNEEVEGIYQTIGRWEKGAVDWGKKLLYNGER